MSLIKSLSVFFTILCCGCVQQNKSIDNALLVKFRSRPGIEQLENLEKYISSQKSGQLKSMVLVYNETNKEEARYIESMMYTRYGFHSILRFIPGGNEHVSVLLEYNENTEQSCYQYALSDFNWYKSTEKEILNYTNATICDTVDNDTSARM